MEDVHIYEEKIEIEFSYYNKKITFQCYEDEKMKDIFKNFEKKFGLINKKLHYLYNGKKVEENMTINEIVNKYVIENNKMIIFVFDSKESEYEDKPIKMEYLIICQTCKENIKMDIKEFKINLYECKNGHKIENILLNEFEETQKIELDKIICDECKKNNKSKSYNKYYICEKHNNYYTSFCEDYKKNICSLCNEHEKHTKFSFTDN